MRVNGLDRSGVAYMRIANNELGGDIHGRRLASPLAERQGQKITD